ncbi:hypothetical protein [Pontivivens nitratireducens]|nr:hypothetical protein [Pontibrevibacter nitratireducens]
MNMTIARFFTRLSRPKTERCAPFDHPDIARMDQRMRDDLPTPGDACLR